MKKFANTIIYADYKIGSHLALSNQQLNSFVQLLHTHKVPVSGSLGGRGSTFACSCEGFGRVVVKHYRRGGVLGKLIERYYFPFGMVRAEREYLLLRKVRSLGIKAPEPLLFASKGLLLYQNWLVTREVPDSMSLAQLATQRESEAVALTRRLAEPIVKLITHGICHVDLHPGNVLVGAKGDLYLLDFDKAHFFSGSKRALRDYYLRRWRRAVIKHNLPEALSEVMCLKLRSWAV